MSADASGSVGAYDSYHQEQQQLLQDQRQQGLQDNDHQIQYHQQQYLHQEQRPDEHEQHQEHSLDFNQLEEGSSSQHDLTAGTKECSVRGCTQVLPVNTPNKMCEACRGRHRVYASTKRARRKLEKAAVANVVKAREAMEAQGVQGAEQQQWQEPQVQQAHPSPPGHHHEQPEHTVTHGHPNPHPHPHGTISGTLSTASWEQAIDPRLFSAPVPDSGSSSVLPNPVAVHMHQHQHLPRPHSTSSELANALTLPAPPLPPPPASASPRTDGASTATTNTSSSSSSDPSATALSTPASVSTSQNPYTRYFRVGDHAPRPPPQRPQHRREEDEEKEEDEVLTSLQGADSPSVQVHSQNESPAQPQASTSSAASTSNVNVDEHHDGSSSANETNEGKEFTPDPDAPPRYCSVKGCKNVIPGSYAYKMCPACRTRYRTYGITKRAKWKLEREAFDKEMAVLREVEDAKRMARGDRSLSECPDKMREWELSIIDEQVPLPQSVLIALAAKVGGPAGSPAPAAVQAFPDGVDPANVQLINQGTPGQVIYLPSAIDTSLSHSPYPHLNNPLLMGNHPPLPARMCTVSHCHKILPGFYRYKRCEQHRLQNRHHSKLKRVREKVVKAVGPSDDADVVSIPEGFVQEGAFVMEDGSAVERQPQAQVVGGEPVKEKKKKKRTKIKEGEEVAGGKGNEAAEGQLFTSEPKELGAPRVVEPKVKQPHDTCISEECQNLLAPGVRWRNCEDCRIKERRRRFYAKQAEKAARGERTLLLPADMAVGKVIVGMVTGMQYPQMMNGQGVIVSMQGAQEQQQGQPSRDAHVEEEEESEQEEEDSDGDISMGGPDADLNMGHDEHTFDNDDHHRQDAPSGAAPSACAEAGPSSSTSIQPSASISKATTSTTPVTSTANLITMNDPLAFRAYKPKSTTSAIGRIIAKNPHLSVDVFTDLLLPNNTQIEGAVRTAATQNSSAPGIVHTPTIPTSMPFIYQPPARKHTGEVDSIPEPPPARSESSGVLRSTSAALESATYHYRWKHLPATTATASTSASAASAHAPVPTPAPAPVPVQEKPMPEKPKSKRKSRTKEKPTLPPAMNPDPAAQGAYGYLSQMHSQYPYPYYMPSPYGMSPYGMPPLPTSSGSSSSSSSTYPAPLPYPYQPYGYQPMPPPPGYPYMHAQYMPGPYGQPPIGYPPPSVTLPPGIYPAGTYPVPPSPAGTYPPPHPGTYSAPPPPPGTYSAPHGPTTSTATLPTAPASTKPTTRKISQKDAAPIDPKFGGFSYYLNPEDNAKRKRRKIVDGWEEKYQQSQSRSASTASSASTTEGSTYASALVAIQEPGLQPVMGSLDAPKPSEDESMHIFSAQEGGQPEQPQSRKCANKSCHRTAPLPSTICDKCKIKFKKHQAKAKQRFKLEPRKSLARPSQNHEAAGYNVLTSGDHCGVE